MSAPSPLLAEVGRARPRQSGVGGGKSLKSKCRRFWTRRCAEKKTLIRRGKCRRLWTRLSAERRSLSETEGLLATCREENACDCAATVLAQDPLRNEEALEENTQADSGICGCRNGRESRANAVEPRVWWYGMSRIFVCFLQSNQIRFDYVRGALPCA